MKFTHSLPRRAQHTVTVRHFEADRRLLLPWQRNLERGLISGVSVQSGAHDKLLMCALSNNVNIGYTHKFYER